MTILGKVLVFFVLLFSLITGGMMVKLYLTSTNWKKAHEDVLADATVMKASLLAEKEAARTAIGGRDQEIADLKKELDRRRTEVTGLAEEIKNLTRLRSDQETVATTENTNNRAATLEMEKLKTQRTLMEAQVNERNATVVKLNKDIVDFRNRAVQAEISLNAMTERAQNLMVLVEKQTRELNQFKLAGIQLPSAVKRAPAVEVRGTVEDVAGSYAQITLGRDHGLSKDDELQVYRLAPEAKYLGTLKLVNLEDHRSVGIFTPATKNATIMKGDTVDTKVTQR